MNAAADDVIIVGGGHNGLVAAAYLARAGRRVTVLEARGTLGGAVAGDRIFPGVDARLSRFSYLVSLLPQAIVRRIGPGHRAPFPAGALVHPGRRRWRAGQPRRGRDLAAGPEPARLRDRARTHPHPAVAARGRPPGPARSRAMGRAGRAPDRGADRIELGRRCGPGCAADRCADRHLQLRARSVAAAEPLLPLPRDRQRDRGVAGAGRRHGSGGRRARPRRDSGRRQPGDQRAGDRDRAVEDRPDHRPAGRRPGAIGRPRAGQLRAGRTRPAGGPPVVRPGGQPAQDQHAAPTAAPAAVGTRPRDRLRRHPAPRSGLHPSAAGVRDRGQRADPGSAALRGATATRSPTAPSSATNSGTAATTRSPCSVCTRRSTSSGPIRTARGSKRCERRCDRCRTRWPSRWRTVWPGTARAGRAWR